MFVHFLGELEDTKSPFEIIWPSVGFLKWHRFSINCFFSRSQNHSRLYVDVNSKSPLSTMARHRMTRLELGKEPFNLIWISEPWVVVLPLLHLLHYYSSLKVSVVVCSVISFRSWKVVGSSMRLGSSSQPIVPQLSK